MSVIKRMMSMLLPKLIAVNSLVILIVILFAGISLKEYACFLVNSKQITGPALVRELDRYLIYAGMLSFVFAGFFHYFFAKRIVRPLKALTASARKIEAGAQPLPISEKASGELNELIESFNSMAGTLSSVQKQRDEMLKDIAHELRTPLTNINGYLEALKNGVIEGEPELFGSLLEESQRITRIVERITELQSWQPGNQIQDKYFEKISLDEILTDTLTAFQLKLNNEFTEVTVAIDPVFRIGNKDGLKQVFTNLLQNVIDYNLGETLEIALHREGAFAKISFTHIGQQIAPDKSQLIFERFYRLEESRSRQSEGAGLGLAIAKSIIHAHGGEIGLDTDGSKHVFWIALPL